MSILGVMFVLAAAPLQGNSAVEGPLNPGQPLWGDDALVWDMGEDSSTYIGPGMEYCDLAAYGDTLFAVATRCRPSLSSFHIYQSHDGVSWTRRRFFTDEPVGYNPKAGISEDGEYFYVAASVRGSDSTFAAVYRYDNPAFFEFVYNKLTLPSPEDIVMSTDIVQDLSSGDFWLFASDVDGNLYLSTSQDNCATWGDWTSTISNIAAHSAIADDSGNVCVTYRDTQTGKVMLASFSDPENWTTYEIGDAAEDASPRVALYPDDPVLLAVTYHDSDANVIIATSTDMGSSWNTLEFGPGYFPGIDVDRETGRCALSYANVGGGSISVASASTVGELSSSTSYSVTDQPAYTVGPAPIRCNILQGEDCLLYMSTTAAGYPKDLWLDSSLFTGIEDEGTTAASPISVFPNPAAGAFTASFQLPEPRQATLAIYSADGRLVAEVFSGITSGAVIDVDRDLPAGVYAIVLRTEGGVSSRRVVSL